jgi:hypothetical protein
MCVKKDGIWIGTCSSFNVLWNKCFWNLVMLIFVEGGKPGRVKRKTLESNGENQQTTQLTYDVKSRNGTLGTHK